MAALATVAKKVWSARRLLVLLFAPLTLLPVVFALPPKEGRCLFVILLMAIYWCTEALPLSVTALLPIILFPFFGILPSNKVCPQYFLDTNFLFLSGLIMASAIEEWNLHRRIALKVLMLVGVQPARLILGMMVTTSFLSMWLSNTASTAMMLPIASAILKSLFSQNEAEKDLNWQSDESSAAVRRNGLHPVPTEMQFLASPEDKDCPEAEAPLDLLADCEKEEEYRRNIWKGFLISIPYSASIGGTATLTGTAPNLILLGQLKRGWRKKKSEIKSDAEDRARAVIREEFQNLGPIKFAEQAVFTLFCMFAILLFSRDPKFIPGWASFFTPGFLSDAVTGVAIVIILFIFPSQRPSFKWWFDFKGVRAVCVDRWAAAPPGEHAPSPGCAAHHRRHRLLHRVCQQHGHNHHLPAGAGRAGHPSESAPPVFDDPRHGRLLLRLHAPSLDAPQLHCLRLWTPAGQRHGTDRPPDEPHGCPAAQLGHEYLGTDHLPAGRLPRLGRHPLSQHHSTAIRLGQRHISDPLSPPSGRSSSWALSEGFCHHLLLGLYKDDLGQFFSVIQYAASKGDLQWSTWAHRLII
ncbi:Na(+)/dicarboxylate cotransporter 3 isoform X3 [Mustela nigripes]|uniref:Na(+)/dicarboxylate cotransporter 3 isoform X3 n=1 Tax=Mustela nigripes TaxID=77151 RepID=UPI002814CF46|nr:Na(+)/dicarboxylate cotransporter 3 isoform X3 [Mustela nigripes]